MIHFLYQYPLLCGLAFLGFCFLWYHGKRFVENVTEHYVFLQQRRKDYWDEHRKLSDVMHDVRMLQNWRKEVDEFKKNIDELLTEHLSEGAELVNAPYDIENLKYRMDELDKIIINLRSKK